MEITFFLFGGSIVDTFESEGFNKVVKEIKEGADFQIANFDPKTDHISSFLLEVLGQDDFVEITEKQYKKLLKFVG